MFAAFAACIAVRNRGFMSGSPPPILADTVNSLIKRVKIFPLIASTRAFLCFIECHLEWPDIFSLHILNGKFNKLFRPFQIKL
jgi:hypothetical protein